MFRRPGRQLRASQLLPQRLAVYIGIAGNGKTALEQAHDHSVRKAQHVARAGRRGLRRQIQRGMNIQNPHQRVAHMMVDPGGQSRSGHGNSRAVLRHDAGSVRVQQTQGKTQFLKNFGDFAKIPLFNIHARLAPFLSRPAPEGQKAASIIADSDKKVQSKPFGKEAEKL